MRDNHPCMKASPRVSPPCSIASTSVYVQAQKGWIQDWGDWQKQLLDNFLLLSQPSDSSDDGKYSGIPNASPSDSNNGSRDSGAAITIVVMVVLCFCFGGASAAFYWFKIKRRHFFKPKAMSSEDLEEAKHAQKSIMLTAIKTSQSIKKVITNDLLTKKCFV